MDRSSHLSVILDLCPTQWFLSSKPSNPHPLSFDTFLSHLLVFLNSHIACKHENSLAVFGALPGKSVLFYSSEEAGDPSTTEVVQPDANSYRFFKTVDQSLVQRISREFDILGQPDNEEPSALVGALTKAICYINRLLRPAQQISSPEDSPNLPDPRILILSVSPDASNSYIPVMNSIFSAQKLKITIDVCKIFGPDSVFLQQAAYLTGGSYIYLEHREALLQYLIMSFLPTPSIRKIVTVPTEDKTDFRAACFCHKHIVDVGYVCSVCLSIFCQPVPVCSTCRTKFPMKTLQRLNMTRASSQPSTPRPTNGAPAKQVFTGLAANLR